MGRLILGAVLVSAAAGCAVGPGYRRPELGVPAEWRRTDPAADSLRPFYDSLMANRDTVPLNPSQGEPVTIDSSVGAEVFLSDTAGNLAWFDLLRDPELRKLVETALRENRDVRVAVATIDEFRAQYGVAKGDFFPQITLNAQGGRIKSPIANPGAFGTFSYNQLQATANLSWELDFWGRIRRS
ncbi:MAG TPA: TolC family protein, partial [Gemmatimonadales bacterium]|nr:TolC family protein [Gemmatimonadales bacterium]